MIVRLPFVAWMLLFTLSSTTLAASWSVRVGEDTGLPVLSKGGVPGISASYVFWADNWKWADLQTTFKVLAPFDYAILGENQTLHFDLASRIKKTTSQQLGWTFDLHSRSTQPDAVGGGIAFKFDLGKFGGELGEPERLPNNQGWAWGRSGGSRIEMRFTPALAAVFFERGRKEEIRAYFYKEGIPAGHRRYTATLSVSGDMAIGPTTSERFDPIDLATWTPDILDWKTAPVDLSFLNAAEKPAGKRGFLKAVQDKLVFEDGVTARFWGTNLTAYALFGTSKENVRLHARRLSALGFNLVRIHHHDSPWVNPNIVGADSLDTHTLNPAALEKLDWWIKCLKEEGIYVWLDLHVERQLSAGDQIDGFDEIRKGKKTADLKGYNYVNPSIQKAMKRFNEAYLNHINAYTGVAYKHEPAIMALLITNENDVTHHFGNLLLPDKNVAMHNGWYMNSARAFSNKTDLPLDKVSRAWEPGPAKLFLNDLEYRFNIDMISHLRELGARVPIATTNLWGDDPFYSLPALTAGDIVDVHSYGSALELEKNPLVGANMIHRLSAAQIASKPMSVTEWNVSPFPAPDRHSSPLYMASAARLQGWDAVMLYAYSVDPLNAAGSPSNWQAFNDPALMATLPAAALLYRRGHNQEAATTYALALSKAQLFYQANSADTSLAARTAAEKAKLVMLMPSITELPWLKNQSAAPGATVMTNLHQSMLESDVGETMSDTGEIRRNWAKGMYTINTPRTQAAMGWIGNEAITLSAVTFDIKTRNASVAVQSLSDLPIQQARSLLISFGARALPSVGNTLPFRSEPVSGQLTIRAPKGLRLYKKFAHQQPTEIPFHYSAGKYFINLDAARGAAWLFLK